MTELALGTVQFGMDYGISNTTGKVNEEEVFAILDLAKNTGIDILDTAGAYGSSEEILGRYFRQCDSHFKVISKFTAKGCETPCDELEKSLSHLGLNEIYGYMLHNFESLKKKPELGEQLSKLKENGKIKKIGYSLYYPEELEFLLENQINFDIVQVPFSIFDQRFANYFKDLKAKNVEIYVRSVFLQGLFFLVPEKIPSYLSSVKNDIKNLQKLSDENKVPIHSLCLNFALLRDDIDAVVIGVDSIENLKENIQSKSTSQVVLKLMKELEKMKTDDENVIIPYKWNK